MSDGSFGGYDEQVELALDAAEKLHGPEARKEFQTAVDKHSLLRVLWLTRVKYRTKR